MAGEMPSDEQAQGALSLSQFATNFTLMCHAGFSGTAFAAAWTLVHWALLSANTAILLLIVITCFFVMGWLSMTFSSVLSTQRFNYKPTPPDYDWFRFARWRMTGLMFFFSLNCAVLIWASGALASPFIPFFIMVFTLALNYCDYPHPAIALTTTFVGLFVVFILAGELPSVQKILPLAIDPAISGQLSKKVFDGVFATLAMLVPFISMWIAARKKGGAIVPSRPPGQTPPAQNTNPTQPTVENRARE
jgi:hypothetical protein